ncbi:hypothetical protein [Wenjunlia vitaminophila]|uniref:hypothetical protein n=1 Tax=Wenjunlia vitaminophila TaxID=76728 RepID=UPI00036E80CA|nr:hypothetical protein [Wenjunlia vitaminophila]
MTPLAAAASGMTSTTLTSAGLAVGIALLAVEHVRWYRGGGGGGKSPKGAPAPAEAGGGKARDPKVLIPCWSGVAFGTLMVACPAGLLGTGAGILRWGGNGLGDLAMSKLTGQSSTVVAEASAPALDGNGALVVTAGVIGLVLLRKTFAKAIKGRFWRGVWAGTLVTIGTGMFAYIGDLVVPGVNSLGAQLVGAVVHGSVA